MGRCLRPLELKLKLEEPAPAPTERFSAESRWDWRDRPEEGEAVDACRSGVIGLLLPLCSCESCRCERSADIVAVGLLEPPETALAPTDRERRFR